MCNPIIAAGLSVAGTVMGGISSYNAANQQAEIARAEAENAAKAAENNAALARAEAEATSRAGAEEESRLRQNVRRVMGAQRTVAGASGVEVDSGSSLDTVLDTAVQGERDADTLRENYQRKRVGLQNEASMLEWNARESRAMGDAQAGALRSAGRNSLFSSLISSAGTVASKWDSIFPKRASSSGTTSWIQNSNSSYGESYGAKGRSFYKGYWGLN